jgi:nickel/cobalt transporter (NicO) family protein
LSAIAIGQVAHGLLLVLAFSSGLAMVLTSLGLVLIYAKKLFVKLPTGQLLQVKWTAQAIPAVTALVIMLVGLGISYQALWQMQGNASII